MKTIKPFCLSLLVLAAALPSARAADTDINPALLYYRAFLLQPDLAPADSGYLSSNIWQNQKLPDRVGQLLTGYDNEFKLVRLAAQSTTPCDWGLDVSSGPQLLLPQLARSKAIALTARLRVQWYLQNGQQDKAREDLLATFALARNLPRDGTLISSLVQFAMTAIQSSTIAANFGQFSPETLQQLNVGLDALPSPRTVAECTSTEKVIFLEWTRNKVLELRQENPGNDPKVVAALHQILAPAEFGSEISNRWQQMMKAAGGTSDGILRLLREREEFYGTLTNFLQLPYAEFIAQEQTFSESIAKSPNPFISESVPSFIKAREREFRTQATFALVRAAIEYKLHGQAGLNSVTDPCGNGPFSFQRFTFDGVDRGFELRSAFDLGKNQAVLVFVEKEGPPFQVDGNYPGRPLLPSPQN